MNQSFALRQMSWPLRTQQLGRISTVKAKLALSSWLEIRTSFHPNYLNLPTASDMQSIIYIAGFGRALEEQQPLVKPDIDVLIILAALHWYTVFNYVCHK